MNSPSLLIPSSSTANIPHAGFAQRKAPPRLFANRLDDPDTLDPEALAHWRRKDMGASKGPCCSGWSNFNTPLARHAYGPLKEPKGEGALSDFSEYLDSLLLAVPNPHILDPCLGEGSQWLSFLRDHPQVRFSGGTVTPQIVLNELRPLVTVSTAGELYLHYEPSSFDLIVCHYGAYEQAMLFIENALLLLKIGGELIFSQPAERYRDFREIQDALAPLGGKLYSLKSSNENFLPRPAHANSSFSYTIQLQKIAEP